MTEDQAKLCVRCKHFCPPTDPIYNKIPEFGSVQDTYNFGPGYMNNSRCNASVDEQGTSVLVNISRSRNGDCGPDATLHEEKPIVTILDSLVDAIREACKSKI